MWQGGPWPMLGSVCGLGVDPAALWEQPARGGVAQRRGAPGQHAHQVPQERLDQARCEGVKRLPTWGIHTRTHSLAHTHTLSLSLTLCLSHPRTRGVLAWPGMYVLVEAIAEGDKVKAEMVFILQRDQLKHLRRQGLW